MSARLKVLMTGFGPFPGMPANPSGRLALNLARLRRPALADMAVETIILPTTWDAVARVPAIIARMKPDVVLMLGVAGRRKAVCVEMHAVNRTADTPDAERRHPAGRIVVSGAPAYLRPRVNGVRLRQALGGVPAALSRNAGRYLCNALYFHVLDSLASPDAPPAVFVHIPARPRATGAAFERRLTGAMGQLLVALAAQRRRAGACSRPDDASGAEPR